MASLWSTTSQPRVNHASRFSARAPAICPPLPTFLCRQQCANQGVAWRRFTDHERDCCESARTVIGESALLYEADTAPPPPRVLQSGAATVGTNSASAPSSPLLLPMMALAVLGLVVFAKDWAQKRRAVDVDDDSDDGTSTPSHTCAVVHIIARACASACIRACEYALHV